MPGSPAGSAKGGESGLENPRAGLFQGKVGALRIASAAGTGSQDAFHVLGESGRTDSMGQGSCAILTALLPVSVCRMGRFGAFLLVPAMVSPAVKQRAVCDLGGTERPPNSVCKGGVGWGGGPGCLCVECLACARRR